MKAMADLLIGGDPEQGLSYVSWRANPHYQSERSFKSELVVLAFGLSVTSQEPNSPQCPINTVTPAAQPVDIDAVASQVLRGRIFHRTPIRKEMQGECRDKS